MAKHTIPYYINKIVKLQQEQDTQEFTPFVATKRYALYPVVDDKAFEFYQAQEASHWTETEMEFIADVKHYDNADSDTKHVINSILGFFLLGDGVISMNLVFRFILESSTFEEQAMFISQLHIELVHAATYGLAAITFLREDSKVVTLLSMIEKQEAIQAKVRYMEKYSLSDLPKFDRYIAQACAEGIFFCSLFPAIFFFRSRGWFPNFIYANDLIRKDESLHRDYGIMLALRELDKATPDLRSSMKTTALAIITDAVIISSVFMDFMLPRPIDELSSDNMKLIVRLMADSILFELGCPKSFGGSNPFPWYEDISLEQKTNFYERYVASYTKKSLAEVLNWRQRAGLSVSQEIDIFSQPENIDV